MVEFRYTSHTGEGLITTSVPSATMDRMKPREDDELVPPSRSESGQVAGKTAEAAVAAIPVVGGPLAVVVATLFGFSYDRRLAAWREEVFDRIRALEEQGVSVQDLANDDAFLDALAQATRTAEAQSSEEKRRYLADALFNIGAGTPVTPDKQAVYLRYLEELTISHMQMLAFLTDPPGFLAERDVPWPNISAGGLGNIVQAGLPELYADKPLLDTVLGDLQRFGLADSPGLSTVMTGSGLRAPRGTDKGREFMRLITRDGAQ